MLLLLLLFYYLENYLACFMLKYLVVIIRATFLTRSPKNKYYEKPVVRFMCDSLYTSNLCYNLNNLHVWA